MDDRGQATIEWLGVLALVALVLTAAALTGRGAAAAHAVVRQMHRALCIVSGGICDLDRRPCVVAANATADEAHVNLGIFRLGRNELILRERRSDGSVLVTYLHDTTAGIDVGAGADWWVRARALDVGAGESARAALLASLGAGETWRFADGVAADRGMAYLGEGRTPLGGQRIGIIEREGLAAALDVRGGGRTAPAAGRIDMDARIVEGGTVDEQTGRRSLVVSLDGSAAAGVLLRVSRQRATGTAGAVGEVRIAVTSDATGRALELSLVRTGQLEGAASLPKAVQAVAGRLVGDTASARRWVVEQRLDLTNPENLQAARRLIEALQGPLPVTAVAQAAAGLDERLGAAGVTEARAYSVRVQDGGGLGGHIAAGVKVGGGIEDRSEWATLVAAEVRGADGVWRRRAECLA